MRSKFALVAMVLIGAALLSAQDDRQLTREKEKKADSTSRTALVIGNSDYIKARTLVNPANDAVDMARSLTSLGFNVISGNNLDLKQMNDKVREFGDQLKASGGVGLFYYAGHGIQVGGRNYLIPVNADIPREDEVDFNALNLDLILRKMATANNGLNIVILDACRNNPFARSWSRGDDTGGLAQITAPTGTFIAYATSPDRTASDGTGRNGLYTGELLKYIPQMNMKIEEVFKQVTIAVDRTSGGAQVPWTSSSLRGDFYFKSDGVVAKSSPNAAIEKPDPKQTAADLERQKELDDWEAIKNSRNPDDFQRFVTKYPNGIFANQARTRLVEIYTSSNTARNPDSDVLSNIFASNAAVNVFWMDGQNRTPMKIASSRQDYSGGAGVMGIGGGFKQIDVLNGGRSQLRFKSPPPEFEYLAEGNINISDVLFVVKLKSKSDKREIQTFQKTFSGFKQEDLAAFIASEGELVNGKRIYRIKFSSLAPGEYAVVVKNSIGGDLGMYRGGANLPGVYFDFGIDK